MAEKGIWDCEFLSKREIHAKLREISHQYGSHYAVDKQAAVHRCMDAIMEITPTEVVLVRHAQWIENQDTNGDCYYTCSACKCDWTTIDGSPTENNMRYCPECGARMDSEG